MSFEGPTARGRHTAAAVDGRLFIYGGGQDSIAYDDLFVLDPEGKGFEISEATEEEEVEVIHTLLQFITSYKNAV